ncbi:MAG: zinc ribbon domain-containing protein [Treponema sp.]|nr:zinc ribbon domain-containing protein [Treponema sp.]
MAFCSNCGTKISDNVKFCPNCGNSITGEVSATEQKQSTSVREETLNELNKLYQHFSKKENEYKEFCSLEETTEEDIKEAEKNKKISRIALPLVVIFLGVIYSIVYSPEDLHIPGLHIPIWIKILIIILIAVLSYLYANKHGKKQIEKARKTRDRKEELRKELFEYYNQYEKCPIGIEYTYPPVKILDIMDVVRSGRADKISDAINLILDDIHKAKVENSVKAAESYAAMTAQSAANAADAARKTEIKMQGIKNKL